MSTDWLSRCESNGCLQTCRVIVDDVECMQIWDSELGGSPLLVTVAAWEAHEAAVRAEGFNEAIRLLQAAGLEFAITESAGSEGPTAVSSWL